MMDFLHYFKCVEKKYYGNKLSYNYSVVLGYLSSVTFVDYCKEKKGKCVSYLLCILMQQNIKNLTATYL